MERSKTESITNLLNAFLREQGLETPLNQHRDVAGGDGECYQPANQ